MAKKVVKRHIETGLFEAISNEVFSKCTDDELVEISLGKDVVEGGDLRGPDRLLKDLLRMKIALVDSLKAMETGSYAT